jgi:transposase
LYSASICVRSSLTWWRFPGFSKTPKCHPFRALLAQLKQELEQPTARIEQLDVVILHKAKEDEACQRLTTVPGVGPVAATALIAAVDNGSGFRKGRDLSGWIGMVPRGHSGGGKQKLLGSSKRGNA